VNSGSPIAGPERVNSGTERVNSEARNGEPRFTRTTKNHQRKKEDRNAGIAAVAAPASGQEKNIDPDFDIY